MQPEINAPVEFNIQDKGFTDVHAVKVKRGLRSEALQDIVSHRPDFVIRWGTFLFFAVFCLLVSVCWFVRYPEIIKAPAKLTCLNAPKPVVNLTNGKLIKLWVKENEIVTAGQILGFVESTAIHNDVIQLASHLDSIQMLLTNNRLEEVSGYMNSKPGQLGEVQSFYQVFSQAFLSLSDHLSNGFYKKKKKKLYKDLDNLLKLHDNFLIQKSLQEEDVLLTQKTFDANEKLNHDKVISEFDYRNEKSKVLNKKLTLPQINSAIIANESQQNEKEKEIMELENSERQQKLIFQQALSTFKSQVDDWMKRYTLVSSVSGRVAFASFIEENQQLQANETICFINPENSQYYAEITIPQSNFGKVKMDQKVLLKFQSYPYEEYGSIKGTIAFISHIPVENGYLAKVNLTDNLTTTFGEKIQYHDGLLADAEIITKEMRLLERFYYHVTRHLE